MSGNPVLTDAGRGTRPADATTARSKPEARYRPRMEGALALADGTIFRGRSFGAAGRADGELVFTTTMVGYQEVCTDPSFRGQVVCMTYPLIGNYGVNRDADESCRPWIAGLVVREESEAPSHYLSEGTLGSYLQRHNVPALAGVDTRAVTRHIRATGDIRSVLVTDASAVPEAELVRLARSAPLPGERDVVGEVTAQLSPGSMDATGPHIVVVDCGVKRNILHSLARRGARTTVVPFSTGWDAIARLRPDGVVVSPGPGDPANLDAGLDLVRAVLDERVPFFGICLGHQLLARSIGATTSKLKFGHRGGNHPVRDVASGQVTITSQNHGFEVNRDSLPAEGGWEIALVNLNDGSVEGLRHRSMPVMSAQFHPEASPGPADNDGLFDQFLGLIGELESRQLATAAESSG